MNISKTLNVYILNIDTLNVGILNTHWIHIEMLQNMVQYTLNTLNTKKAKNTLLYKSNENIASSRLLVLFKHRFLCPNKIKGLYHK